MNNSIDTLSYIGPYFRDRFLHHSYWPLSANRRRPIRTLNDLAFMLRVGPRRQDPGIARQQLSAWLKDVLSNARAEECLLEPGSIRRIRGRERAYRVRRFNRLAFNSVIDFWRSLILTPYEQAKIPRKISNLSLERRYPLDCEVE